MTIVLLVEGDTEITLKGHLKAFLDRRAEAEGKPQVRLATRDIMTRAADKVKRRVALELRDPAVSAVVALVDVYPKFRSAAEAKAFLTRAADDPRSYAHAALYDVEAWLLPYWEDICRRVGARQPVPGENPELVDELNPPAHRLRALYQLARPAPRRYAKATEMNAILRGKDLAVSAARCPELKAFLNTLLALGGLEPLP
jgi:hypothetical protein